MKDITSGDGILTGGTHNESYYEGCPKPIAGSDGDRSVGHTGTTSTTSGPHSSNMANKVDPRIDSDRDGHHNLGGFDSRTTHGSDGLGHHDKSQDNGKFGHFEVSGTDRGIDPDRTSVTEISQQLKNDEHRYTIGAS
jgi:hypothetical protein